LLDGVAEDRLGEQNMASGWFHCTACGVLVLMGGEALHACDRKRAHTPEKEAQLAGDIGFNQPTVAVTSGVQTFGTVVLGTQATSPD
jgi:hypothetical protein